MLQTPLGVSNGVNRTVMQPVDQLLRTNIDSGSLAIREVSQAPTFTETVEASDIQSELTSLEEDKSEQLIVHPRVADPLDLNLDDNLNDLSCLSEGDMLDRLDGLRTEDIALNGALRDLRDHLSEDPTTSGREGAGNDTCNGTEDLILPQGLQESTLQLASSVPGGAASAEPSEVAEIVEVDTTRMEAGGNVLE
jgi:hypothetical protein